MEGVRDVSMDVEVYAGHSAPIGAILEFFDHLEYVPAQHDPRWAYVFSCLKGEDFYIAVAWEDGRILGTANYTVFRGPLGAIAHANPFMGYGGCSCVPDREGEVVPALMRGMADHTRQAGCVTMSVAIPPFHERVTALYVLSLEPEYCFSNFFQYSDLGRHPLDSMTSRCRHRIANRLQRSLALGVTVRLAATVEEVEAWLDIYKDRYSEIGVRPLPRQFLMESWKSFAPLGKAELFLAYQSSELLGGGLFVRGRGIVDYFSCAYNEAGMELNANVPVVDVAVKYYMGLGIKRLNWQSSPSRESGVYAFKKRWGAVEGEYVILTKVLADPEVLICRPLAEIRDAYCHHFVLPYVLWDGPQACKGELKPRLAV
jgi:hypothetical protein